MRSGATLVLLLTTLVVGVGCQRVAGAQSADPALGPIGCFELVADELASTSGLELCTAATSAAPGECYMAATTRRSDLPTGKMITLCRGATSLDPLDCFERLDAGGDLTDDQILGYCAAVCPLGPAPPQYSSAACVSEGLERTNLVDQQVAELCVNSHSASPVDCYLRGERTTQLTDSQLVGLCAQRFSCQYINAPPPE
jgi:hypothetical protein